MRVLVAVASENGSTLGVAEAVARTLRRAGHAVDVRAAAEAGGVDGYGAVVVGSGIYYGRWSPAATGFVRRHGDALAQRPVWFFSVGGWRTRFSRSELGEIMALQAVSRARDYRYFTGAFAWKLVPVIGRIAARLFRRRYLDGRNWPAITAWARAISDDLSAGSAAESGSGA